MTDKFKPIISVDKPFNKRIDYLSYNSFQKVEAGIYEPFYILDQPFPKKTIMNEVSTEHEILIGSESRSPSASPSKSASASPSASLPKDYVETIEYQNSGGGFNLYVEDTNPVDPTYAKKAGQSFILSERKKLSAIQSVISIYTVGDPPLNPADQMIRVSLNYDNGSGFPGAELVSNTCRIEETYASANPPGLVTGGIVWYFDDSWEDVTIEPGESAMVSPELYLEPSIQYYFVIEWAYEDLGARMLLLYKNKNGGSGCMYKWLWDDGTWTKEETLGIDFLLTGYHYSY